MSIKAKILERFVSVNKKRYLGSNTFTEIKKMPSSDAGDKFGYSIAVSDTSIVVGAPYGDTPATDGGTVYIFDIDGNQIRKIQAGDAEANDHFGWSVAVSSNRIVVGSPYENTTASGAGSAYIFDIHGNQLAKIQASDAQGNDHFGWSVAVSDTRIVVGALMEDTNASSAGSAYIFDIDGNQLAKIQASDPGIDNQFGYSVAVSDARIVVGAWYEGSSPYRRGSAYIFDTDGNQLAKILASDAAGSDYFGSAVSVSNSRIVVGAPNEDTTGSDAGSAYIFDIDGNQLAKIQASDAQQYDNFGQSVAVSNYTIIVGAPNEDTTANNAGSAYLFDIDGNQLAKIQASDAEAGDNFGGSVAASDTRIAAGSRNEDTNGSNAGAAYVFRNFHNTYDSISWAKIRLKFTGDVE